MVFSLYFPISSTFAERFNPRPEHCPLEEEDGAAIGNLVNCLSFSSKRRVFILLLLQRCKYSVEFYIFSLCKFWISSDRINLSPFTKDFRGVEQQEF